MRTTPPFLALVLALSTAACGDSAEPVPVIPPAGDTVLCAALGADYLNGTGTLSVLSLPSRTVFQNVLPGAVSGDPVVRKIGAKLYIVNRFGENNVTIVDPSQELWRVERQFSTGEGTNPQDVALVGTKLYVVTADAPDLQIWDLATTSSTPSKTISLASLDVDGNPDANSIYVVGTRAFVTLDLLDRSGEFPTARGEGKVAIIDTATDTLTATTLTLNYANPYGFLTQVGNELLVPSLADFSGFSGCVERIGTSGTPSVSGCLVENTDLGNYTVSSIAVTADQQVFLAVSAYDVTLMEQTATIRKLGAGGGLDPANVTPTTQTPSDVAYAPGVNLVVYSDRESGGLRVWDVAANAEVTTGALAIGLAPATQNALSCWTR
jgi:DNA-binding beta-propeller fold protein YncE